MTPSEQPCLPGQWPLVYILLVNWNTEEHILGCLASLRPITYPNYRILIVDNASTDGSPEAIQAEHPDIPLVRLAQNEGFTGANNVGFRHALERGAKYVYLLNADARVAADFLTHAIKTAIADPSIGIVGSKVLHGDQPERLQFTGLRANLTIGYNGRPAGYNEIDRGQWDHLADVDLIGGCTMLISRTCLDTIGEFDDAFFAFQEDFDYCLRAKAAGFRVVVSPYSRVWHYGGGSVNGNASPTHMYYSVRNTIRLVEKHRPAPSRTLSLMRAGCVVGAHAAQVLLNRPSLVSLREIVHGYKDYFRGIVGVRPGS